MKDSTGTSWAPLMNKDIVVETIEKGVEGNHGCGAPYGAVVTYSAKGYFLEGVMTEGEGMMSRGLKRRSDLPFEEMQNYRAQIGESDTIMGLELALRHANQGGVLRVRMSSRFGYGPNGRKAVQQVGAGDTSKKDPLPAVPPSQDLEYEVTVSRIIDLDDFMINDSQSEYCGDFEDIHLRKECGNRWFYYGDYERAARAYSKGATKGDAYFQANDEHIHGGIRKQIWDDYISCMNNLSACHISGGDYYKAKEVCIKVLELEDTNIKALLRAARSSLALFSFEECEACIVRVLQLEPENKLALQERAKLAKSRKEYKGKKMEMDKQMTKYMFGRRKGKDSGEGGDEDEPPTDSSKGSSGAGSKSGDTPDKINAPSNSNSNSNNHDYGGEGGDKDAGEDKASPATTSTPGAQGYGESSNLILLLLTAIAVLLISVWLAMNSKIDVNEPIIPPVPKFGRPL